MFKGRHFNLKAMPLLFTLIIGGALFFMAFKTDVIAMPGEEPDYIEVSEDDSEEVPEITEEEKKDTDEEKDPVIYVDDRLNIEDVMRDSYNAPIDELIYKKENGYVIGEVEEDYFADALFIGDSRTVGLSEYCEGLDEQAMFYAKVSLSIYSVLENDFLKDEEGKKMTVEEALEKDEPYGKIYIMLGLNELGTGTTETFVAKYAEVIARIRELQPDATIYIQSIMHVTENKSSKDKIFNNERINERNEALSQLANNVDIFYLDMNEAVDDENGNMLEELSTDDIHLKASSYERWHQYLLQHAIVKD